MKRILVITLVLMMTVSSLAFAVDDQSESFKINGATVNRGEMKAYVYGKESSAVPLKALAESLGYEFVEKEDRIELVKLPHFITISLENNSYGFGKMAPQPLKTKPLRIKDEWYVPSELFSEIMGYDVYISPIGVVEVQKPMWDEPVSKEYAQVEEILEDRIKVNYMNDVAYVIFDEKTVVSDPMTSESLAISDLVVGDMIRFTTPPFHILIYPAQYYAYTIERLNDHGYVEGTIHEIGEDRFTVGSFEFGTTIIKTEKTSMVNRNGLDIELNALRIGNKVRVYHSLIQTFSIPPQTHGVNVFVDTAVK